MTAAEVVHPARQADVEAWLTSLGVDWRFDPDLRLAQVDVNAGLANQVRHEPLHEEVVERYTAAMSDCALFPPIIATDTDTPVPLGGNHRVAAANRARIVGIAQPKLSIAANALDATRRADAAGIDGFARLPEPVRYEIGRLAHDAVFTAAAELALTTGMPVGTLRPIVAAVVEAEPSEALRLIGGELEDHRGRATQRGGNVRASSRTQRAQLETALATIMSLSPIEVYDSCPNDDVRATVAERLIRAATPIRQIHELLLHGPAEGR